MQQKIVLIVSVVVGFVAAILTHSYLKSKVNDLKQKEAALYKKWETIEVMTVNKNLPSGTVLSTSDLAGVAAVKSAVQGKAIETAQHMVLVGRKTTRTLNLGEVIFWTDIEGGRPDAKGLASDIKNKMRAISVNVTGAASVSSMVQPNDHVDVLGTFTFPSQTVQGEMELVTLTIMQDVLVLATGKETAKTRLFSNNYAGGAYNTVTLEVTPREAEMLVFAEQIKGRISLALRNPNDVYYEVTLPRVDFNKIESEIENLNENRQKNIHSKRTIN
ncbi:MAG: Flp pilus assembly protein CpaB [Kiritimatiellaeota bacterium]|nr:Flp pilus assembly protein CpaB [Kiritimatiellota bacterium]